MTLVHPDRLSQHQFRFCLEPPSASNQQPTVAVISSIGFTTTTTTTTTTTVSTVTSATATATVVFLSILVFVNCH